jgi:hypothetical protein
MYRRLERRCQLDGREIFRFYRKYQPKTRNGNAPDIENHPENLLPYVSLTTPDEIITSAGICRAFCIRKRCLRTK